MRAAGPGEWLAAALLVSAFYLEPVAGNAPWSAALVLTCLAGAALVLWRPRNIRLVPPAMVLYVAVYALSAVLAGHGAGSDVARYIVRPVALGALTLFLTTPASRRRVIVLLVAATLPQVAITAGQTVKARIDFGGFAARAADSVTGTFGAYGGGPAGLVAIAVMCLAGGAVLAGVLDRRRALGVVVAMLALEIFTATRAAVAFVPVACVGFVGGVALACGRRAPPRALAVIVAAAALSVPAIYGGTELIYPGSFIGAFSNQESDVLGNGAPGDSAPP
ncbi:MAG: hypothetical protein QOJ07_3034, partial [Thermoleophilaceae bacterium]|nr:hypothetical protein [Thermoleophilaceae bacterium]